MDLARKRQKHCISTEEYDFQHTTRLEYQLFFLGNKGSTQLDVPYLGKPSIVITRKQKGIRVSFLSAEWDLVKDELVSSRNLDMPFFPQLQKNYKHAGKETVIPSCSVAEP